MARIGIGACAVALLLPALAAFGGGGTHVVKPAERHLTYLAGDDLAHATVWLANIDGSHARPLGRGSVAVLSPDGRSVGVLRKDGIYVVSTHGSAARRLTSERLHPQAWSPDGKTLFASRPAPLSVLELDAVDTASGKVRVVASGSLYGFSFSPDGSKLIYSRAPVASGRGLCGDQFDLYVAKLDGSGAKRITTDGLSAFPVWGDGGIAFTHFPGGTALSDCGAAGVGTIQPDGSSRKTVIDRMTETLTLLGFYGFQPLGWLGSDRLLVGLRSDAGTEGAVLDVGSGKLRRLNQMADQASSDGRFALGSGGDDGNAVIVVRLADGRVVFKRKNVCCPDWNR